MADLWKIIKAIFKFIFVVIVAFLEGITVSFYKNIKKWYNQPSDDYRQLKVPSDYKDEKVEPEYKDLSKDNSFSDFGGLPGFK